MDDPSVQAVFRLLVNRVDDYLAADPRSNSWFWQHKPLTVPLVQAAVHGRLSLGIASVSGAGTSKHLVLDADSSADLPVLYQLAARLAPQGNVLLELSRRGGHLLIFGPPTDWRIVHAYGQQLVAEAGPGSTEVYPKFAGLHGMKLPGSVHPRSHRVYPAINPATGEVMDVRKALLAIRPQPLPRVRAFHQTGPSRSGRN